MILVLTYTKLLSNHNRMAPRCKLESEQKKAICMFHDKNPSMRQVNLISHFNDLWGTSISKSLMSTILKDKIRWVAKDKDIIKRLQRTNVKSNASTSKQVREASKQMAKKDMVKIIHWNEIERKYEWKMVERTEENDPDNEIDPDISLEDNIYGDASSSPPPLEMIIDEMDAIYELCEQDQDLCYQDPDLIKIMDVLGSIIQKAKKKSNYKPGCFSFSGSLSAWGKSTWNESGVEVSTVIERLNDVVMACEKRSDVSYISKAILAMIHNVKDSQRARLMEVNGKTIQWNQSKRKYEYKMQNKS